MIVHTTQTAFASRFGATIFIIGKLLRFGFFLLFLVVLVSRTNSLAGYSFWEVLFFFATFNLIDALPQFFLREVYRFRWHVISGNFDFMLLKPISALFRAILGGSDIFDLVILALSVAFIGVSASHLEGVTIAGTLLYVLLIANAFVIALAFHICVVALGVLTTEVDNAIMLYRDITQMGRIPVDVYAQPIRSLLTFAIPVWIMMTAPAKAFLGLLTLPIILFAFCMSGLYLWFSLLFWKYSLKRYASASS